MTSLILDIETLSRHPNAIVTEIAAIAIKAASSSDLTESGAVEFDSILIQPCIATQLGDGRHFEAETLAFHDKNHTLPESFTGTSPLVSCMTLGMFISKHQPRTVWIWGKDFDRPILENLYQQHRLPLPWQYWQTACARDAWKIAFGDENKPPKRNHKAIDDCRATLRDLATALKHLDRLNRL
jgi:hypothetical protein